MSTRLPKIIAGDNVSRVWAEAFIFLMKESEAKTPPLLVSVAGFENGDVVEDAAIKTLLDAELTQKEIGFDCNDVAFTIFPHSYWNPKRPPDRKSLYSTYLRAYPRLLKRSAQNFRRGTYFQRLIAYDVIVRGKDAKVNQLERILDIWHTSKRHSGLQASCFDASKDHVPGPYLGFPCLQQVSFDHDEQGGLSVNAFYATQHFFVRAYGNYLGLCHLGQFMAHEMGLRLVRMNCFVGVPRIGRKKEDMRSLEGKIQAMIPHGKP